MKQVAAVVAVLLVVGLAHADCRRAVVYRAPVYHQPYYAPSYYVSSFLQVPVPVYPIYGVGFADGGKEVAEAIRELTAEIRANRPPVPAVQPASAPRAGTNRPRYLTVLENKCLSCHQPGGSGFKKLDLSDPDHVDQSKRILAVGSVSLGRMPKDAAPLSDEELQALAEWAGAKK